jgi:hypothetical protein
MPPQFLWRSINGGGSILFAKIHFDRDRRDSKGSYLVVEVKPQLGELDEAIGKILRHRKLFTKQNNLEEKSIRAGIVCPYFPDSHRRICQEIGIEPFEIST